MRADGTDRVDARPEKAAELLPGLPSVLRHPGAHPGAYTDAADDEQLGIERAHDHMVFDLAPADAHLDVG
jgi:hypothetical protein